MADYKIEILGWTGGEYGYLSTQFQSGINEIQKRKVTGDLIFDHVNSEIRDAAQKIPVNFKRAIEDPSVVAIIVIGDYQLAELPDLEKVNKPVFASIATQVDTKRIFARNYFHCWGPTSEFISRVMPRLVYQRQHRRVLVVHSDDTYGKGSADLFERNFKLCGTSVEVQKRNIDELLESMKNRTGWQFIIQFDAVYLTSFGNNKYRDFLCCLSDNSYCGEVFTDTGIWDFERQAYSCKVISPSLKIKGGTSNVHPAKIFAEIIAELLISGFDNAKTLGRGNIPELMAEYISNLGFFESSYGPISFHDNGMIHLPFDMTMRGCSLSEDNSIESFWPKEKPHEEIARLLQTVDEELSNFSPTSFDVNNENLNFNRNIKNIIEQVRRTFGLSFIRLIDCDSWRGGSDYLPKSIFEGESISRLLMLMKKVCPVQCNLKFVNLDLSENQALRIFVVLNDDFLVEPELSIPVNEIKGAVFAKNVISGKYLWDNRFKNESCNPNDKLGAIRSNGGLVFVIGENIKNQTSNIVPVKFSDLNAILSCLKARLWKNECRYEYIIPNQPLYGTNTKILESQESYAILGSTLPLTYLDIRLLLNLVTRLFYHVHTAMYLNTIKYAHTKAAIGSIMSRNGSHNIGSHVLAALSHNVGTMPDDRLLYQYIQHRMDYIATATTDFPTWSGETKLVNGLIRRFLSQRHLLDHIAGSEGLHSFKFQDPNVSGRARREQTDTIKLHIRRKDAKGTIISDFITEDNETNGGSVVDKLKNDISVAMPGGVIGAHAFFTILENVIRNAAKHGWARQKDDKQNQGAKAENLDIYVDFILDADGKNITVTIFDNISDVFSVFDDSKMTANEKVWLNKYRDNLKDDKEGDGTKDKRAAVVDFLAGKGNVESLPVAYKEQHKILSARTPEELKDIADRLMGEVPSDGSIGNRLWLPLHHSQDIKLRQSFIDDAGTLRRENWGLAEMKISAGYLNKRSISDIGGITEGLPIVTPVCVEQQETVRGKDDQVPKRHLGYQFKIPRPREIAFVCDRAKISQAKIDQLQTLGIFVTPLPEEMKFFKPKNEGDNDWNYSYVVLPSFPKQENPHLPFRVLVKDKSGCKCPGIVPEAEFYATIVTRLQSDESAETIAESLKKEVYRTWIDYWCEKRGFGAVDYSTRPPLRIMPTEVSDSGSNQGLVSNYEVWDFVFKEMFRSIVGDLLQKADAGEFFVAEDVYWYLAILAVMPKSLGENGSVFTFKDKDGVLRAKINDDSNKTDHHERELIFRQLNQWFDEFQGLINDNDSRFELRPALQEFSSKYVLKFGRQNDSATNNTIDSESGIQCASVFNKEVMKAVENRHFNVDDNPLWGTADSDNGMICFLSELCSAYREADVMLRKYEERIVSLPAFLGESQTPNKKQGEETNAETIKRFEEALKDEKNGLGITLHYGITSANWSGRAIVFARHAKSDDYSHERMLYFEPLSGTQSYLYELMQLPQSDSSDQILTRMYETGLSRVLIIDERVSKFLRSRPDEIKTFCRMGIWCVDEKKFGVAKEVDNKEKIPPIEMLDSLIEFNKEKFDALIDAAVDEDATVGKNEFSQIDLICNEVRDRGKVKFDILIIHQGLIDKWLPQAETNSKRVESFIHVLRTIIPYVVITTGRGTPANTPDSARILPFPVLEATLFKKYPEKMVLVDTIMNILPVGVHT